MVEQEGRIIGYLLASLILGEGELLRIAVSSSSRVQGVGKSLAAAMLRDNPATKTWRLDVRQSNYGAIKLYEALGFQAVIRRRNYYEKPTEDGIMMMLEV